MTEKQSKIEVLEQVTPEELLNYQQGTAIEISFKEQEDENQLEYPSMFSRKSSETNSWKKNRGSQDELDCVVGIKRSSYALEDSFNSDSYSFSYLNASVNEEDMLKSKLANKLKELKQEEHIPSEKQLKMYNQSIFTEKVSAPQAVVKKQSESSEGSVDSTINYGQSFYMTPKQPVIKPQKTRKQVQRRQRQLNVSFSSKNYFLQIKQVSVEIDRSSLEDLYNQLFKKQIFVPLFNYERYEQWAKIKDYSKYTTESEAHMNFKVYLERYIAYLNQYSLQSLQEVIQNVQMIQQGKNEKKNNQQSAYSLFNFDFYNILDNLKSYINSNKYEVLRKTLLAKVRSIKAMMKEKEKWKISSDQAQLMNKTLATTWIQLAEVQFLLGFESTEELCSKKIQSSPELKFKQIWLKYRDITRQEKGKILSSLEDIGL